MPENQNAKNNKKKTDTDMTGNDALKYEIAEELGLMPKVRQTGWRSLTAKESGRIGGMMTKRRREKK